MTYSRLSSDEEWSASRVAGLPPRWRDRILGQYDERRAGGDRRESNLFLLSLTEQLDAVRLPLGANDGVICDRAGVLAAECAALAELYHEPARRAKR